jgi:hypothetical protein
MSSLISAFFIKPIARRFSNANAPPATPRADVAAPQSQSHVNGSAATTGITDQKARLQQQMTDGQSGGNLGQATFDRFVPLVASSQRTPIAVAPEAPHPLPRPDEDTSALATSHDVTAESAPVTTETGSITIEDQEMSPFDVPERFAEAGTSPSSARLTRNGTVRRTTARDIPRASLPSRPVTPSASLPADDGMRLLRARRHEIRELAESQDEKARRMHELMTAEWKAAQQASIRPQTPASMVSQDRSFLPNSPLSFSVRASSPLSTSLLPFDPQNPYNLEPEDLRPSYRPTASPESPTEAHSPDEDLTPPIPELGCKHYKRNVKIQCYDCKKWYPCRHCHDADQPGHHLNRRATENMLCMLCYTPQAAGQWCKECGERGAWYYCDICKLWDDDGSKSIYHCSDCGICRRGEGIGKDFVHCKVSDAHTLFLDHRKLTNASEMQRVYLDIPLPNTHMHRKRHRLKLPPLPRLHVHFAPRNRRNAMRPLSPPSLLFSTHAVILSMSYL